MKKKIAAFITFTFVLTMAMPLGVFAAEPDVGQGSTDALIQIRTEQANTQFQSMENELEPEKPVGAEPAAWNPISVSVTSGCLGSVCVGSGCIVSYCVGSGCGFTSGCSLSGCAASGCGMSVCLGSVCGASGCIGSACAHQC